MTDQALDQLARRLLLDAARLEYGPQIKEPPDGSFSPAFDRRMKKLLRRAAHPVRYRFAKAAACAALVVLLSGCSVLAFSPQARAAFVGWVREVYASWSVYHYTGETEQEIMDTVYYPAWVPQGYTLLREPQPGTYVHALYENQDQQLLRLSYLRGEHNTSLQVQWKGAVVENITINGRPAELYRNPEDGPNVLVWSEPEQDVVFWLTAALTPEELVRTAESVQESDPLPRRYFITWLPPDGYFLSDQWEEPGKGEITFESNDEIRLIFGYSDDLPGGTPYDAVRETGSGEAVHVGDLAGTLYPAGPGQRETVLLWQDADHLFWISARDVAPDAVLQTAESVIVKQNNFADTMQSSAVDFDPSAPLAEVVEQALTPEFIAKIQAQARRDAIVGVYMLDPFFRDLRDRQMTEYISPDRDSAIAAVSESIEAMGRQQRQESVLALFGPFYSANINVSIHVTTAHICDEYGEMIAGYNSMAEDWIIVPTLEEEQFDYTCNQIYAQAFREARAEQKEASP